MKAARLIACFAILAAAGRAQRSPLAPDRVVRVRAVLDAMYRLDFDAAESGCRQMMSTWPDDPVGSVYLARVYWQELLVEERALTVHRFTQPDFFVEKPPARISADPAAAERFRTASRIAIERAERAAQANPRDPAALFLLGAAYQNEASFMLALSREWWQAFRAGSRSERAHRELLALDRNYSDALLVTGLFHYTVGALPWNVRWIPLLLGYHGTKEAGEKEMEEAVSKGQLVADDARALLAVLYAIDGRTGAALAKLNQLRSRYPENPLTQMDIAGIRMRGGDPAAAIGIYTDILGRPTPRIEKAILYNQVGIAYRWSRNLREAENWLRRSLGDRAASPRTRVQAQVELGKTLDLAGRRDEARAQYNLALQSPDFGGCRAEAARFLKAPYKGK